MESKKGIFFCYAHEDEQLLKILKMHLKPLQHEGHIDVWYDRDISAGEEWEQEISKQLNSAQIILLLVSPDFINSDYCYGIEMKRALERHKRGEARVIPVILRPINWQGALGKIQALPTDGHPATSSHWHNLDEAFYDVAEGIRKAVEGLKAPSAENNSTYTAARGPSEKPPSEQPGDSATVRLDDQPFMNPAQSERFDVCLSYTTADAEWVEKLAKQLRDEHGFQVRLNKQVLSPGKLWQQTSPEGVDQEKCYVICIGELTPVSWFRQEVQRALDRQGKDPTFRIIPVLLPDAKAVNIHDFPELRVWVDFRTDYDFAFYLLECGVKGVPAGRRLPKGAGSHKSK